METFPAAPEMQPLPKPGITVDHISYHGWSDCHVIANECLEAVVVPIIGRVMQLRRAGESDGVFWENRALDGRLHDATSREWLNFGGDKCWPAPQSAWPDIQGRRWPPPAGFDARPLECIAANAGVTLTSPIDPDLGIRFVRRIGLDPNAPVMRISTEFHKIHGLPVRVAVWTISQLRDPQRIFLSLPPSQEFADGYVRLMDAKPHELRREGQILSLARHPSAHVKIGTKSTSLLWVGSCDALRIDTDCSPGDYPDGGCVAEVYTSPDPLPYVELETMSPLAQMRAGDSIAHTTVYTLMPSCSAFGES